jgi:hypothetical protein
MHGYATTLKDTKACRRSCLPIARRSFSLHLVIHVWKATKSGRSRDDILQGLVTSTIAIRVHKDDGLKMHRGVKVGTRTGNTLTFIIG